MTKKEFLTLLYAPVSGLCESGQICTGEMIKRGLIEAQDLSLLDTPATRNDAARFIHLYLKKIKGDTDLPDISAAGELKDLYDCRLCVNHIAQVYLKGLIKPVTIPGASGNPILIFNGREAIDDTEAEEMVSSVQ